MNRDELREAMAEALAKSTGLSALTCERHADALLDGPVGDLLAENERLRDALESSEQMRHAQRTDRTAQAIDRLRAERNRFLAERDRLRATVDQVRDLRNGALEQWVASDYSEHDSMGDVIDALRRILDGTDGGDRDE